MRLRQGWPHALLPGRRRLAAALFTGLWLAACSHTAAPPSSTATAPVAVRQALAPTGALRVAVYPGSPTSLVRGPGAQEMRGLTVELGQALARELGVPVKWQVYERVPQIVDALKTGEADFTLTNASPARARDIDFTLPVVQLETGYLVPAGSRLQNASEVDQAGIRLGVAQGSTSQGILGQRLRAATLVALPSVVVARQQLQRGELDAFATNKAILFDMADQLPGARVLPGRWGLEQLAIGVPKGREAGADWLKGFVQRVGADGTVQAAAQRAGLRGLAPADAR